MVSVVTTAAVDLANPTGNAAAVEVLDQVGGAKIAAAVVLVNAAGEIATLELGATSLAALGNITVGGTVDLGTTSLAALENITVGGSVELGSASLAALENVTVELGATSLAALEDITVGGTVELGTASLNALESVTAELGATSLAALESITVGGTVELGATSLAALESITVADVATEATLSGINDKLPALSAGRIPVELPAGGGGLTNTELRDSPVPTEDVALYALTETLRDLSSILAMFGAMRGADGALRVNALTGSTVAVSSLPTLAAVTTLSTLTTLSNQTSLGGFQASNLVQAQMNLAAQQSNIVNMLG